MPCPCFTSVRHSPVYTFPLYFVYSATKSSACMCTRMSGSRDRRVVKRVMQNHAPTPKLDAGMRGRRDGKGAPCTRARTHAHPLRLGLCLGELVRPLPVYVATLLKWPAPDLGAGRMTVCVLVWHGTRFTSDPYEQSEYTPTPTHHAYTHTWHMSACRCRRVCCPSSHRSSGSHRGT